MENFYQPAFFDPAKALAALNDGVFVDNWRKAGIRVLRANERMLGGLMNAARLEVEFGRELVACRMSSIQWEGGFTQALAERPREEVARLTALMRGVNQEVSTGFREAVKLLTESEDAVSAPLAQEETIVPEGLADEIVLAGEVPGIVLEDVLTAAAAQASVTPEPEAPLKTAKAVVAKTKAPKQPLVQPKKVMPPKRRGK